LTKLQIIDLLRENSNLDKKDIAKLINNFFDIIKDSIDKDNKIDIRGFGTFYKLNKKARKIKSKIAGGIIDVPAKSILAFKASKTLENIK
jgi:DNA-binding protein HU-beta